MKNKFCREILSLTFLALLFLHLPAQPKALKIGDAIPEKIWMTPLSVVNAPQKTIELGKDRGKLILLDFWATWCSACLKGFPKMEDLQKQYGDRLKIIPVTSQDRGTLEKFFATKNGQRFASLQSVVGDQHLKKLFPHVGVPFVVWIKDGKLLNTTDADQVTALNVTKLLNGETSMLQTVIQMDRSRPLMLAEQYDLERETSLMNYVLLSKGRIRATAPGTGFHRKEGTVYGRQFTNMPLTKIYSAIARELFGESGQDFSNKRIVNQVKDHPISDPVSAGESAAGEQLYSFELIAPLEDAPALYQNMLHTLNRYSGYTGSTEIQRKRCWVLRKSAEIKIPTSNAAGKSKTGKMQPLEALIADLNDSKIVSIPVIDESGYKGNVPIDLSNIPDLESLKGALKNEGFQLTEEEKDLFMFVLEDRSVPPVHPRKKIN